jgi:serine/threonine protein kinase
LLQAVDSTTDIVHGDVKPQNVLVFQDKGEPLVAKVADFGYSCFGAKDDDFVRLPMSRPWNAPEWHHREFRIYAAKKTDVYSFGMLCLWVLFNDELLRYVADADANTTPGSIDGPWGGSYWTSRLEKLKEEDKLTNIADELISKAVHLTAPQRVALEKFFEGTLCRDWKSRESDFEKLIRFLNRDTYVQLPLN